jgi:hypothetical protein
MMKPLHFFKNLVMLGLLLASCAALPMTAMADGHSDHQDKSAPQQLGDKGNDSSSDSKGDNPPPKPPPKPGPRDGGADD